MTDYLTTAGLEWGCQILAGQKTFEDHYLAWIAGCNTPEFAFGMVLAAKMKLDRQRETIALRKERREP